MADLGKTKRRQFLKGAGVLSALQHSYYPEGCALAEQELALARQIHDTGSIALCLNVLTNIAINQGDYAQATMLGEECIALCRAENNLWGLAVALWLLAQAVLNQGEAARARALLEESLVLCHQTSQPRGIPNVLLVLGTEQGLMTKPQATMLSPSPPPTYPARLTPREMDVLCLLAQGLTSAQIAKQLVIGVVTVNFHVRSIYSKLGVSSRIAATRYAIEHKLV